MIQYDPNGTVQTAKERTLPAGEARYTETDSEHITRLIEENLRLREQQR